jgi:hypothetical protein
MASHEPGSASAYSASNLFAFQVTLSDIHPPPNAPVFRVHGNRRFFPWTLTCFTGHLGELFRFCMTFLDTELEQVAQEKISRL